MNNSLNGFIVLHRKMLDWGWYTNTNTKVVFLHLLLTASFRDTTWQGIDVKRGDVITSINSLSKSLGLTPKQVRTALQHLEKTGETATRRTANFRIITILNYNFYQDVGRPWADQRQTEGRPSADRRQHRNNNNKYNNNNNKTKERAAARESSFDVDDLESLSVFSQF